MLVCKIVLALLNFYFFETYCCRNSKWGFLEGVKVSGAPPPRKVIVQQCIRDTGILDALCEYVGCPLCYYSILFFFFCIINIEFSFDVC